MPAYLITGRSGVGKTTICQELRSRGYFALDADRIPGLASWRDPRTNLPVVVDYSNVIDKNKAEWRWDKEILRHSISLAERMFLCGSADNQLKFHPLFDKVFILTLAPALQRQRIMSRTEHGYGKLPSMQEQVIREQRAFVNQAQAAGGVAVEASPSPAHIVNRILRLL